MIVSQVETNPPGFADWSAIHALVSLAFASMEGRIDPPSSLSRMTAPDFAQMATSGEVFVLREGPMLVGCLFGAVQDRALYLSKLAVHPDWRGHGIARALVAAARVRACALGLGALTLQTRVELVENHATFAALGFAPTGQSSHPGYDRPTSLTFTRPLPPPAPMP